MAQGKDKDKFGKIIQGIVSFFKKVGKIFIKILLIVLLIFIIYLLTVFSLSIKYSKELKGTCIESNEYGSKQNVIPSTLLNSGGGYTVNNGYKHDEFSQKMPQTDLNLKLTGEPITINIVGEWIPWFGDITNKTLLQESTPRKDFICILEKANVREIGENNTDRLKTFSNKNDENEFYYIKNYYSNVKKIIDGEDLEIKGVEEVAERQKACWITRGAGLYIGMFGANGKIEPTAYHHLISQKQICSMNYWFNGEASNKEDYVLTKYQNNLKYTVKDFIKNYFSVSYFMDLNNKDMSGSLDSDEKKILTFTNTQVIYNIDLHEKLLYKQGVNNPGFIIANAINKFSRACYGIEEDANNKPIRNYNSYFQFGPKTLYKNVSSLENIKYNYGEIAKMLIVDKFYDDNQGFYRVEFISGIEFDDAGNFEKKIREVEFFLLGTPNREDPKSDRIDGKLFMIFNNILSSGFAMIIRIFLCFAVIIMGVKMILGIKEDGQIFNYKDALLKMLKLSILSAMISPSGFSFLNRTIINFVINGTIGIIDLIAGLFSNVFTDSSIILTGGLKYANEVISLSRNFAIIDEILGMFSNNALTAKIMSFSFNFDQMFFIGLVISIGIFLLLGLYILKLIQSVIPFFIVLLQLTIALPLSPLFITFGFFSYTKSFFENWLKFILSKSLELISFFTAFYFCTGIINDFIKKLLNFKVCFIGLGDKIFGTNNDNLSSIQVLIKNIFNSFTTMQQDGLPDNYVEFYFINIAITFVLVLLFSSITKDIMSMVGSMLTIDDATADVGGSAFTSDTFKFNKMAKDFNKTMGLDVAQKEIDGLKWTRGLIKTDETMTQNVLRLGKLVGRSIGGLVTPIGDAMIDGKSVNFKEKLGNAYRKTWTNIVTDMTSDVVKVDGKREIKSSLFAEESIFGSIKNENKVIDTKNSYKTNKQIEKLGKQAGKNLGFENIEKSMFMPKINSLINKAAMDRTKFVDTITKFSDRKINKIFAKDDAEKIIKAKNHINESILSNKKFIQDNKLINNLANRLQEHQNRSFVKNNNINVAVKDIDKKIKLFNSKYESGYSNTENKTRESLKFDKINNNIVEVNNNLEEKLDSLDATKDTNVVTRSNFINNNSDILKEATKNSNDLENVVIQEKPAIKDDSENVVEIVNRTDVIKKADDSIVGSVDNIDITEMSYDKVFKDNTNSKELIKLKKDVIKSIDNYNKIYNNKEKFLVDNIKLLNDKLESKNISKLNKTNLQNYKENLTKQLADLQDYNKKLNIETNEDGTLKLVRKNENYSDNIKDTIYDSHDNKADNVQDSLRRINNKELDIKEIKEQDFSDDYINELQSFLKSKYYDDEFISKDNNKFIKQKATDIINQNTKNIVDTNNMAISDVDATKITDNDGTIIVSGESDSAIQQPTRKSEFDKKREAAENMLNNLKKREEKAKEFDKQENEDKK